MKFEFACKIAFAVLAVVGSHAPAFAQTDAEFVDAFAGQWQIYDDTYADGGRCKIALGKDRVEAGLTLTTENCNLELAELTNWDIAEGQLTLKIGGDPVATLGGNQGRISGTTAIGAPIILERIEDSALVTQLIAAYKSSGCYYLGFTNTCVDEAQLSKPTPPSDGSGARISILVNLNVRSEARDDAGIIGVVPANSCIVTEVCQQASDGAWCRARFGEDMGWLKKVALRQERWPVVTFVNQCSE